jgi:deazaflavin-dependent oxidoreductase (nitroreductase family)
VLAANGKEGLLSCSIRPGGIYGPGDGLVLPRVVEECASGKFQATVGDGTAKSDNSYIDNLVDGQIEAARHLLPGSPLCGQAYFITDGAPVNYFDFFRPIVEGMGFRFPKLRIPAWTLYWLASAWEFLHWAIVIPPPMLTRHEVRKITISHYSRIDKAKRDFGWQPVVSVEEAQSKCIEYCRELLASRESVDRPHWGWWCAILGGMGLLGALALSPAAHALWSGSVTSRTPRWLLQSVFTWAVLVHVYKGMKAVRMAERAGLQESSMGWGWQTFALGFASLSLLERRIERSRADAQGGAVERGGRATHWEIRFPNIRWLLAVITCVHRLLYRWSNGRLGDAVLGFKFLLLIHRGRKTGNKRVTPLLYVNDGDRWVVAASNAGDERHPAWWHNLTSRPDVRIQVGSQSHPVRARQAAPEELERLWQMLTDSYHFYSSYRMNTERDIPVVILERA